MYNSIKQHLEQELDTIRAQGLYKEERIIVSAQGAEITLDTGQTVLNFCANNYLGLANHPEIIQAAKDTMDTYGFGMASVRFICGTQDIHKKLEQKIADFYQTEDTILYAAAFDANGGVFEPLLTDQDAIISDSLNHASIIDGVRLCKAKRFRYKNNDMADLEVQLKLANESGARFKIIVTDGVFSMDGLVAPLDNICDLAEQYDAMVMIDECHAAGFIGKTGIGTSVALVAFNVLVKKTTAIFASSVTYLIPIVAIFWGFMDGEIITWNHFVSIGIILGGIHLVNKG